MKDFSNSVSVPQVHQVHLPASRQQSTQVTAAAKNKSNKPSSLYTDLWIAKYATRHGYLSGGQTGYVHEGYKMTVQHSV